MTGGERPLDMAVVTSRRYVAALSSVRAARRDAAGAVHSCGLGDNGATADTVALLVSELTTNAVKATANLGERGKPGYCEQVVALRLTRTPTSLAIEVWDGDDAPPALAAQDDPEAESGRGLLLIEALSTQWGHYHPLTGGKVVWCTIKLPPAEPAPLPTLDTQAALDRREPAARCAAPAEGHQAADPIEFFDDIDVLRRVIAGLRTLGWELPRIPLTASAGRDPHLPRPRDDALAGPSTQPGPASAHPASGAASTTPSRSR